MNGGLISDFFPPHQHKTTISHQERIHIKKYVVRHVTKFYTKKCKFASLYQNTPNSTIIAHFIFMEIWKIVEKLNKFKYMTQTLLIFRFLNDIKTFIFPPFEWNQIQGNLALPLLLQLVTTSNVFSNCFYSISLSIQDIYFSWKNMIPSSFRWKSYISTKTSK